VFSGALFTELYGVSTVATGLLLGGLAVAYLAGNRWGGRSKPARARRTMLGASIAASVAVALTWAFTPGVPVTVVLFSVAAVVVATRTVAGTVYGFAVAGDLGREVGAVRAATTQLGYLVGSLLGGAALAVGGFGLLAVAFGGLFLGATLPYLRVRPALRLRSA
jgi:predicted MFS family arabinose efflux permease